MPCFEVHLPGARHRDAGGIRKQAPMTAEIAAPAVEGVRRKIIPGNASSSIQTSSANGPRDILIVASKLKDYISAKADMNTSAAVMEVLSDIVRRECDDAIDRARSDGRKTVLDRDFKKS